jgi:hypothetical protein
MKICPVGAELFHENGWMEGQTNMAKVIFIFCNFTEVPNRGNCVGCVVVFTLIWHTSFFFCVLCSIKKGYQLGTNIVKDEKGNLAADCHSILTRWRNYFSQLLNVHEDNDVKQTEIHTAEPLVPEPSVFEVEMVIEKLKRYKSPGIDQIPSELIKAGGIKICSEIHKLVNSIWNKEELPEQWKESVIVPVYRKGDKTDCSNYRSISLL